MGRSRISPQEEIEHQVTYLMTRCTFMYMLICQRRLRLRTTSPDYSMTRETITITNQGWLMAINYGGGSADPDPEEEEVSILSSSSPKP